MDEYLKDHLSHANKKLILENLLGFNFNIAKGEEIYRLQTAKAPAVSIVDGNIEGNVEEGKEKFRKMFSIGEGLLRVKQNPVEYTIIASQPWYSDFNKKRSTKKTSMRKKSSTKKTSMRKLRRL